MWQNVVLLISTHKNVTAAEKNVNKYLRFLVHDKMTNHTVCWGSLEMPVKKCEYVELNNYSK